METKIKAIISLAVIVILFLIIIRFKIKSDKKRKSLAIPYNETIKPKGKQVIFSGNPKCGISNTNIIWSNDSGVWYCSRIR